MVEMGIFNALAVLKATSLIFEAQLAFSAHQKYIIWFLSYECLKEFGLCFLSHLYFHETGSHGWIISCS